MNEKNPTLTPGSQEAIAQGCTCAVLDNENGLGRFGDGKKFGWFLSENCPLHGKDNPVYGKEWPSSDVAGGVAATV